VQTGRGQETGPSDTYSFRVLIITKKIAGYERLVETIEAHVAQNRTALQGEGE
jgi:hypothetical protein